MKRFKVIYNEEVLTITPKNPNGKLFKFNKNVTKWEKTKFRAENYEKKVESVTE